MQKGKAVDFSKVINQWLGIKYCISAQKNEENKKLKEGKVVLID